MTKVLSCNGRWRRAAYAFFVILGILVTGAISIVSMRCFYPSALERAFDDRENEASTEAAAGGSLKGASPSVSVPDDGYDLPPPPCHVALDADPSVAGAESIESFGVVEDGEHIMQWRAPDERIVPRYFVQWRPNSSEIIVADFRNGKYVGLEAIDVVQGRVRTLAKREIAGGDDEADQNYEFGFHADISPDGRWIVFTSCDFRPDESTHEEGGESSREHYKEHGFSFYELAVMAIDEPNLQRVTTNHDNDFFPMWSPDGRSIAFLSDPGYPAWRHGYRELRAIAALSGGAGGAHGWNDKAKPGILLGHHDLENQDAGYYPSLGRYPPIWSPDGTEVAIVVGELIDARYRLFHESFPVRLWEKLLYSVGVYIGAAEGSSVRRISGALSGIAWSPDGERLALVRVEGDGFALVTIASDGSDPEVITRLTDEEVIGEKGERDPRSHSIVPWIDPISWSPDGSHILFGCGGRVCVVTRDGKRVGGWPLESVDEWGQPQAAWSPDGSRIAVYGEFDATSISSDASYRIVLFTMAPDGGDIRYLLGRRGEGELDVVDASRAEEAADVRVCAAGRVVPDPDAHAELVRDCETLWSLRKALAGTHVLDWWGGQHLSTWRGVAVGGEPSRVQGLQLGMGRLSGTIPRELGGLSGLTRLQLVRSHLHGIIPAELSQLTNLIRLNLSENNLTGEIPAELGQLINLTELNLSENNLTGEIPEELGQLVNLEELFLSGNQLSGCIPMALHRVPHNDLTSLKLPNCEPV